MRDKHALKMVHILFNDVNSNDFNGKAAPYVKEINRLLKKDHKTTDTFSHMLLETQMLQTSKLWLDFLGEQMKLMAHGNLGK